MSAAQSEPPAPRRFQFNLATLLIVMAWIGISCVALRTPTAAWSGVIFCLTLLALATSLLATIYRTEAPRAFAVGFLVCGLAYAMCLFFVEHKFTGQVESPAAMPTTRLAEWLFSKMHPNSQLILTAPGSMGGGGFGGGGGLGGGGGFFSVDSSEEAVQNDSGAGSALAGGAADPLAGMEGGGAGMPMSGGMPAVGGPGGMGMGPGATTYTAPTYDSANFNVIVHCTFTVLLGILGGIIARWLYATDRHKSRAAMSRTATNSPGS